MIYSNIISDAIQTPVSDTVLQWLDNFLQSNSILTIFSLTHNVRFICFYAIEEAAEVDETDAILFFVPIEFTIHLICSTASVYTHSQCKNLKSALFRCNRE